MKAAFYTLGCKVNQYDTEAMLEAFERAGYVIVPFREKADIYLINTCTVTGTGDQKSRKTIRRVAREHPDAAIIVAGCLAQRDAEMLLKMPGVRLVLGVQRRGEVVGLLEKALRDDAHINAVAPLRDAPFEALFVTHHEGKTRATMKIQEGCDRYCAYCIIPEVRGPVRSMPLSAVRAEANRLKDAGYQEIVVTGIHLASYGRGTDETLLDAIRAVHETGVRVRIGSLEPVVVTDEFARALSEMPNLMRQFHLSLQSGAASVLSRMRRRYTPEQYFGALEVLRRFMPDLAATTDLIAGFPGETDEDHLETEAFIKKCAFARIHVFPYSRRSGTRADQMPDQVPEETKKARAASLIRIGNKLEMDFVQSIRGTVQTVLFESRADKLSQGYTQHYVHVRAQAEPGAVTRVLITRTEGTTAYGTPYGKGRR